jgi:hypothetical protein
MPDENIPAMTLRGLGDMAGPPDHGSDPEINASLDRLELGLGTGITELARHGLPIEETATTRGDLDHGDTVSSNDDGRRRPSKTPINPSPVRFRPPNPSETDIGDSDAILIEPRTSPGGAIPGDALGTSPDGNPIADPADVVIADDLAEIVDDTNDEHTETGARPFRDP